MGELEKKIVVTGGTGLVGKELKKILPNAVYLSSKDYDLTLEDEVIRMYVEHRPNNVIHLAAKVGGIIDNIQKPYSYFRDNILMNTNLIDYAYAFRVERFLGVLSSCIFPDVVDEYPMKEDALHLGSPTKTNFSYGMSKRAMAIQIDACNEQNGTSYNYISPCNLYGTSDKDGDEVSHFVTALIKKIYLANKNGDDSIYLYGDGTPLRQFMHASDLAKVIKIMIDNDITDCFNVAIDRNITIDEIARIALKVTNSEHLKIRYDNTKPNGQNRKDLNIEKFNTIIPDYKFKSLEQGISECYSLYLK